MLEVCQHHYQNSVNLKLMQKRQNSDNQDYDSDKRRRKQGSHKGSDRKRAKKVGKVYYGSWREQQQAWHPQVLIKTAIKYTLPEHYLNMKDNPIHQLRLSLDLRSISQH